jgi:hypothetical protein
LDNQKPIQIKLNKIGSDRIRFFFICHPKSNQTTNKFIFESDEFLPQNRSELNREYS